ncbi:MAG: glutamine amidotransferase, partial [Bifidobacterium crudilactis]|nr:glutamine amidotransferase [Bifidobacterium crudilactis]
MDRRIDVLSLYPKDMIIYGDSGNVLSIRRRQKLFGYHVHLHDYNQ